MDERTVTGQLQVVYRKLLDAYGPQYWWPAEESFEVLVGAILTQSAAWRNVEMAISNLKAAEKLSPREMRDCSLEELTGIIYPCGYYNVKARKLKCLVEWLGEYCQDDLGKLASTYPTELRHQLLSVWGIGEETADSIILYGANGPFFVIDAYTRRIIDRIGLAPDGNSYAAYQSLFMDNLPADTGLFNEYHALLVCLAKDACRKKPLCRECCLRDMCADGGT